MKVFLLLVGLFIVSDCNLRRNRIRDILLSNNATTSTTNIRQMVSNRWQRHRERTTAHVCYDLVGCFELPHSRSPLQRTPEPPELLDTKFYLFRRDVAFAQPQILHYNDNGSSLSNSKFHYKQPLKVYIHGYMSRWNEQGVFMLADAYLKLENCNVIIMDWTKGARGPQYALAAANTEITGRQLGLLLLDMLQRGLNENDIHLIGFSLGAHVAGSASEFLKSHNRLIGRITGLDAAGPLFRNNHLKEKSKKLDKSDAKFVDALHTDCSPVFVDGFGLWDPIGHVDFYANGGEEQPGCTDRTASIVVTTFEGTLDKDSACSHIRAYQLYLESLLNKVAGNGCEFISFKCPGGLPSYRKGQCFPQILNQTTNNLALDVKYYTDIGRMGVDAFGDGVMYFVTRNKQKYCGTQFQVTAIVSAESEFTKGVFSVELRLKNREDLKIYVEAANSESHSPFYSLHTSEYKNLSPEVTKLPLSIVFNNNTPEQNSTLRFNENIILEKLVIEDIYTNKWVYCDKRITITKKPIQLVLQKNVC